TRPPPPRSSTGVGDFPCSLPQTPSPATPRSCDFRHKAEGGRQIPCRYEVKPSRQLNAATLRSVTPAIPDSYGAFGRYARSCYFRAVFGYSGVKNLDGALESNVRARPLPKLGGGASPRWTRGTSTR